jgi:hypothetical protein
LRRQLVVSFFDVNKNKSGGQILISAFNAAISLNVIMYEEEDAQPNTAYAAPTDRFKPVFKFYKAKKPETELEKVVDTESILKDGDGVDFGGGGQRDEQEVLDRLGLTSSTTWRAAQVKTAAPGLFYLSNPFTPSGQRRLSKRCLKDFARNPPNRTNLDNQGRDSPIVKHYSLPKNPCFVTCANSALCSYS